MLVISLHSQKCFPPKSTRPEFWETAILVSIICIDLSLWLFFFSNPPSPGTRANLDQKLVVAQQAAGGIVVPGSGRLVACLGVDDLVIVDVPDALMVTTRARAQEVKSLVANCRKAGFKNLM